MSTEMQTKVQASSAQNFTPVQTGLLQKKYVLCNTSGLVEDSVRDKEKLTLQRSSADQAGTTTVPRFGHDFSRARVHSTRPGMIQAKLTINKPGDIYEQEADRVAEQVMRMEEPRVQRQVEPEEEEEEEEKTLQAKPLTGQITPLVHVQRQEEPEEEEETLQTKPLAVQIAPLIQRQIEPEVEEEPIQAKETSGQTPHVSPIVQNQIHSLRGHGQRLSPSLRNFFEPRFGHDFSHVRVHTDENAANSAHAINAQAYTVGRNMVFGVGQYAPNTAAGRRLLGHELVHVIQQGGGRELFQRNARISRRFSDVPQRSATLETSAAPVQVQVLKGGAVVQRAMLCSKRLNVPVLGWFFNHAYVDDTGRDDCMGKTQPGNLAIQQLQSGNFLRGCAVKTDTSTDPQSHTPNVKPCNPKPGIGDVSACLRQAFSAYADPSYYANPRGPNSNTFAGTLARACCADASSKGLGSVPGWNHSPAGGCVQAVGKKTGKGRGGGTVAKVQPRPFTGTTQGTFNFSFDPPRNPKLGKAYVLTLFFKSKGKIVAADVQFRLMRVDAEGTMHWESINPGPVNVAPVGDPPKVIKVGNPAKS